MNKKDNCSTIGDLIKKGDPSIKIDKKLIMFINKKSPPEIGGGGCL